MDLPSLAIFLAIGALAGWIAGQLVKGGKLNILGNMVVGVLGAAIGGWLFDILGVSLPIHGLGAAMITAVVGASILLVGVSLLK